MPRTATPYTTKRAATPVNGRYDIALIGPSGDVLGQIWARSEGGPALDAEATAEFLARAANSHEALVQALDGLVNRLTELVDSGDCGFWSPDEEETIVAARAALKLAGAV
jgi:hypothetical protein